MTTDPRRTEAEKIAREIVRTWQDDTNGSMGSYISSNDEAILVERFTEALLAAEERGARGQWEDIGSAPRDRPFLAYVPIDRGPGDSDATPDGDLMIVWWEARGQWTDDRDLPGGPKPTHWQPLPLPPSPQEGE